MYVWNVEVAGKLAWLKWTPNKSHAMAEAMAWGRLGDITGKSYRARLRRRWISESRISGDNDERK